jgi:hypothetical protein
MRGWLTLRWNCMVCCERDLGEAEPNRARSVGSAPEIRRRRKETRFSGRWIGASEKLPSVRACKWAAPQEIHMRTIARVYLDQQGISDLGCETRDPLVVSQTLTTSRPGTHRQQYWSATALSHRLPTQDSPRIDGSNAMQIVFHARKMASAQQRLIRVAKS